MDLRFWRALVVVNGFVPLALLGWDASTGRLGANGVNVSLHITGVLSLVFLFLSLAVTPLKVLTGWGWLIAFRRALGLFGALYAAVHFAIYVGLDRALDLGGTVEEIVSRRFLQVGFVALLLLVPLAVTSTNAMIRRLGPVRWKLLHRLSYVVAVLGVLHYYMLVKSDVRVPLAFAAVLFPLLAFRLVKHYVDLRRAAKKSAVPAAAARPRFWTGDLRVARVFDETHDVKTFRLVAPDGGDLPFDYAAGQYLTLTLPRGEGPLRRSYTISSSPTRRGHCEITVKRDPDGAGSRYLHDRVREGDALAVAAPAGKFTFDHLLKQADGTAERGVVLVAGGVGLTPMMSIVRALTDRTWPGEVYLVNVIRTPADLVFGEEIAGLARRFPNVHLLTALTRGMGDGVDVPYGTTVRGRPTPEVLNDFVPDLAAHRAFVCGPDAMMDATVDLLKSLGVPADRVATEAFVSAPAPAAAPAAATGASAADAAPEVDPGEIDAAVVTFARSGREIGIPGSATVLEAAEQAGVDIPWECRAGICGQCKTRRTAGTVWMPSRDALTAAEFADGLILACQARPRSAAVVVEA